MQAQIGRPAISAAKVARMREMEARSVPRLKICAILGVDPKTAIKYLGPRKTWIRRPKKESGECWAAIMKKLRARGMSPYKVALAIGCPSNSPAQHWERGGRPREKYR